MSETVDWNDWNRKVIEEFRANGGKVGGDFAGFPLLVLHHVGARTGTARVNPLVYQQVGDAWAIFASKGGAPRHPDWYHNLVANPQTSIEVGTERHDVAARVATGEERDRIWDAQKQAFPNFAQYEESAGDRVIPVVVLEPR